MKNLNRIKELITIIYDADVAYYKHDTPTMTDRDYDILYAELQQLEKATGIILSGSPTQKVPGAVLESLMPVRHTRPMLSSDKTKSVDDIVKFAGGRMVTVSWKLDGLTLVLRYVGGKLFQAITRGEDGTIGEDVTHTVRMFKNVPLVLSEPVDLEVRGEGVISWTNFEKINEGMDIPYTHPRSVAAGAVRRLDAEKSRNQYLEFFAFELVGGNNNTKSAQLELLKHYGFDIVPYELTDENLANVVADFDPKSFAYPVDGLVIEHDDLAYGRSLGATGHHENRLIALKWEDTLYETVFLGLELATTRMGYVSLTGIFEDTIIDGTTVNRAYLHNLDILEKYQLGIGDKVKIYKANMIIPQLAENITRSGTLKLPTECPCCGAGLVIQATEKGTRNLYCTNPSCPAKLVQKFVHFCEKTHMDIPGLSEKLLEKLIGYGWVKNFGDLYELERHRDDFVTKPRFGEKLFDKLQRTIDGSRNRTLKQVISSMGIEMVGRSAGRTLDKHFDGDWEAFESAIQSGFDFTTLPDFGPTMHANIHAWYADKTEESMWRPLLKHINFIKNEEKLSMNNNNPFNGKSVVATGKLSNYTRDGIQMKLLNLGAKPSDSVTRKTDYLIVGASAGGKLDKARSLGVKTLTEEEFEAMCA